MVDIIVNGRARMVNQTVLSYDDVIRLAHDRPQLDALYTVVYSGPRKDDSRRSGEMCPGDIVELEQGMIFTAVITGNA